MLKKLILALVFILNSQLFFAQGTRLLRQPTISSKSIVFVYADDLWSVDRDGGDALAGAPGARGWSWSRRC